MSIADKPDHIQFSSEGAIKNNNNLWLVGHFYEHADYQGTETPIYQDQQINQVNSGLDNSFSSVKMYEGNAVEAFEGSNFGGKKEWLIGSIPNLVVVGFNDKISSYKVYRENAWKAKKEEEENDGCIIS